MWFEHERANKKKKHKTDAGGAKNAKKIHYTPQQSVQAMLRVHVQRRGDMPLEVEDA